MPDNPEDPRGEPATLLRSDVVPLAEETAHDGIGRSREPDTAR